MSLNQSLIDIFYSWKRIDGTINSLESILKWIEEKNKSIKVNIQKIPYDYNGNWHYEIQEKGIINNSKSFFKIVGLKKIEHGEVVHEQPIYIQDEIGYLGIIAKKINGVLYFLMQAKIEPGNINKIQISPTIQATKSNFTKAHGGNSPAYLDYFINENKYEVIVDQIQSEQSSRFLGKRNRNIVILIDEEIEVLESHKWMTLGQIKELMALDNLVNMDTRTVLSCIPFSLPNYSQIEINQIRNIFNDKSLFESMFSTEHEINENKIFRHLNNIKMLDDSRVEVCDLFSLKNWKMDHGEFYDSVDDFKVVFADIEIEGREVRHWQQPLFEAVGKSTFGLLYRIRDGKKEFLVKARKEVGCFDKVELGPSVQAKPTADFSSDSIERLFKEKFESNSGVEFKGLFSEEGGRFYHEENINVLMYVEKDEIKELPKDYFWVDYCVLNRLVQYNNILNIQLRNLLSILRM